MLVLRAFTKAGQDPLSSIQFSSRHSKIVDPDGKIIFNMDHIRVPELWSQVAVDILAQKYFRKAGVPSHTRKIQEQGIPSWLQRSEPDSSIAMLSYGSEIDAMQVFHRLAGCWTYYGWKGGYFGADAEQNAKAFYDELIYMLAHQMAAPNSPQWFNTGLWWAYGLTGKSQGYYRVNPETSELEETPNSYQYPQSLACFIQSINDNLVDENGIVDLLLREARVFKFGSGSGTNFSNLRGRDEPLSGGGKSSGLLSFLSVLDKSAGAIKSGGTTRRAARMVTLDVDHPDIESYIDLKLKEEIKVAAMMVGGKHLRYHMDALLKSAQQDQNPDTNSELKQVIFKARQAFIPENYIQKALMMARQGMTDFWMPELSNKFEGESYSTVTGQNANNSVRLTADFMTAVEEDQDWYLYRRTDRVKHSGVSGNPVSALMKQSCPPCKTLKAKALWDHINRVSWHCADPGLQFDTTINDWNTCTADGRINSSNPCSEYMFLDDTGCFAPETRISTSDGPIPIGELFKWQSEGKAVYVTTDCESDVKINAKLGHYPAVVIDKGRRQVFRMTLSTGHSIRATAEHPFLTGDGQWKRLDQLITGKDTLQLRRTREILKNKVSRSDVRWKLLGWLTGDGVFSKGNVALCFGPTEEAFAEEIELEFNKLAREAQETYYQEGGYYKPLNISQCPTALQITSKARALIKKLEDQYGLIQGTALVKDVPAAVWGAKVSEKIAYVSALFSADGGWAQEKSRWGCVFLASSSPELLRSVQILLGEWGIKSTIKWCHPTGRKNPQGQLQIRGESLSLFKDKVGFCYSLEKQRKLDCALGQPRGARKKNGLVRVCRIEEDGISQVYDISESHTHTVIAEGIVAHNCNLASLNIGAFQDDIGCLKVADFEHAIRLWSIVLEISVYMSQYPSKAIAWRSHQYRTVGLGYSNLGAYLMRQGIPYDSEEARAHAGCITALLHCGVYAASAEMAKELGAFERYEHNKASMLKVIANHRRAVYNTSVDQYENLTIPPVGINQHFVPLFLIKAAKEVSDKMWSLGCQYGYRNAQATVIAPAGTIGLLMDCDTTGVEPDFALVKFKKLAGGGYFTIVNESVAPALETLGYTQREREDILNYVRGARRFEGCPHLEKIKQFAKESKQKLEDAKLKGTFELKFVYPGVEKVLAKTEYEEANQYLCGTLTIEGAPHLRAEHLPVFDCASKCGARGRRFLTWEAHVRMIAAVQPFVSGSISKTVNLPADATVEDFKDANLLAYKLGLKANAMYRDGSKLSQVLTSLSLDEEEQEALPITLAKRILSEKIISRHRLPERCSGYRQKARIGGQKIYLHTGEYEDGSLGEIFISVNKQGSAFRALLDQFAIAISIALQYGVPLEEFVESFVRVKFDPCGPVQGNPHIKMTTSIVDYIFRELSISYLEGYDFGEPSEEDLSSDSVGDKEEAKKLESTKQIVNGKAPRTLHMKPLLMKRTKDGVQMSSATARLKGYEGDPCDACGQLTLVRRGTCVTCDSCGANTGCS